jgi:hypothetical protein
MSETHPGNGPEANGWHPSAADQIEALSLIVAHLAAQLTITQIRLRGLATALEAEGLVDPDLVRRRVVETGDREAGYYLRENLGEHLSGIIDVDDLARQIVEFLGDASEESP